MVLEGRNALSTDNSAASKMHESNLWLASLVAASIVYAVLVASPLSSAAPGAVNKHSHTLPDDGVKDSSFESFRRQLLIAIKQRDKTFVEEIISPEITMALGGGRGKEVFNERWENLSPTSAFWSRMQKVMSHGAQFDQEAGEFHAPALAFEDSHSDLPQCIVWNEKSSLRKQPNAESPSIRFLYNDQLSIEEPTEEGPVTSNWVKVRMADGMTGFMKTDDIYSAYDEFAVFKKRQQKWMLSWFGFAGL